MGGMATGIVGGVAFGGVRAFARGERPRLDQLVLSPGNIARIAENLAQMRGAAMKLGQLLSMETGDMMPPELEAILARLRDDAHFMPPKQLKAVLTRAYGDDFRAKFTGFETTPLAAASIGQVHRATASNGEPVAIKLQYPGVRAAIDSDLDNAATLIKWSGMLPDDLDLSPFLQEARRQLHDEADYLREGWFLQRFGEVLEDDPRFVVPRHFPELSGPDALAMSFEASEPIEALAEEAPAIRDAAVTALIDLCMRELFEFRLMQTDPNFANYRWRPSTKQIVLLDFGAARDIPPAVAEGHHRLMCAGLDRDRDAIFGALEQLGFLRSGLALRHREVILDMAEMGFEALNAAFDFATNDLAARLRRRGVDIGGERELWHIPPADTLFVQRKVGGLYLLASRFGARVNFSELLARYR